MTASELVHRPMTVFDDIDWRRPQIHPVVMHVHGTVIFTVPPPAPAPEPPPVCVDDSPPTELIQHVPVDPDDAYDPDDEFDDEFDDEPDDDLLVAHPSYDTPRRGFRIFRPRRRGKHSIVRGARGASRVGRTG